MLQADWGADAPSNHPADHSVVGGDDKGAVGLVGVAAGVVGALDASVMTVFAAFVFQDKDETGQVLAFSIAQVVAPADAGGSGLALDGADVLGLEPVIGLVEVLDLSEGNGVVLLVGDAEFHVAAGITGVGGTRASQQGQQQGHPDRHCNTHRLVPLPAGR